MLIFVQVCRTICKNLQCLKYVLVLKEQMESK